MDRINRKTIKQFCLSILIFAFFFFFISIPSFSWSSKTHRIINEVSLLKLPDDFPGFLKEEKVWITYQGPEPDRWKAKYAYTLRRFTSPDHYFNLEKIQKSDIRKDRFGYMKVLQRKNLDLNEVGFLPFAIIETYEKLLISFKEYRKNNSEEEKRAIEKNIAYYAGLLGHYVGDGSMPLHTTVHHDGWQGDNPEGFATFNIHGPVESYADAVVSLERLMPLVQSPRIIDNLFDEVLEYLYFSNGQVKELYKLHKEGAFRKKPLDPKGEEFIIRAVSRSLQMLLNLWFMAYEKSKE